MKGVRKRHNEREEAGLIVDRQVEIRGMYINSFGPMVTRAHKREENRTYGIHDGRKCYLGGRKSGSR